MLEFQKNNEPKAKNTEIKVDLQPLLAQCMGDFDMLTELVKLYRANILEFIGRVRLHLKEQDLKGVEFCTHKLKCGLLLLKTKELSIIVEEMHSVSKARGDIAHLNRLYGCFLERYPLTEQAIDRQLKMLKEIK